MSEILSQEEIDALLKGSSPSEGQNSLSADEMEAISEICNVSMNVVSTSLLSKFKQNVTISVKDLTDVGEAEASELLSTPLCTVEIETTDSVKDKTYFMFDLNNVVIINDLLIGGDGTAEPVEDLDDMQKGIFIELIKEVWPESFVSISTMVKRKIATKIPVIFSIGTQNENLKNLLSNKDMVKITYSFEVGNIINGEIIQLIPVDMVEKLVELLLATLMPEKDEQPSHSARGTANSVKKSQDQKGQVAIQSVTFPSFDDNQSVQSYDENIDFILDVPLQVSVELGKTQKMIKEILAFNVGSIVELNNLAEDYVDILVNGKLVARGEVIVVDENFGVRIMEVYTNARNNIFNHK